MPRLNKQQILRQKQTALEASVATCDPHNIPANLFEDVLEFLTYCGDSPCLAHWVKNTYLAWGKIQPPCPDPIPLVSVIIPCHNYARYLRESVESVLMQTMPNWEIIIINDGSTDNTAEVAAKILEDFPGHKIRFFTQECRGIVQPRNRGVTLARGEFILPLDADDLIAPSFLEKTVAVLQKDASLGYVGTKALFFGSSNKVWPLEPFIPLALLTTNQQTNTTLYRKKMWKEVGGYEPRMVHGYMDWEFWIRCTKAGWIGVQLEEPLFLYRRKEDSVVMQAKKRDILIKEQIIRLHPEIYDAAKLTTVGDEINNKNWIPPDLLRSPLQIPPGPGQKPRPTPFSVGEYLSLQQFKRILLNRLAEIFPEHTFIFMGKEAGNGVAASFPQFFSLLSKKINALIAANKYEEAGGLALRLLSRYPLDRSGIIKALQTISSTLNTQESYEAGKLYFSIFSDDEMADCLGQLLYRVIPAKDSLPNLGLLEGAVQLTKNRPEIKTDLEKMKERLGIEPNVNPNPSPSVWYVADELARDGNVNGVKRARFMTLSSLLRGATGPEIHVFTPLYANIAEAIALFYDKLVRINPAEGYRLPYWHCTRDVADSVCVISPSQVEPDAIVTEGVRLDAYNYMKSLKYKFSTPMIFMHHTSPEQYKNTFTDMTMFPELLEALDAYEYNVCVSRNVIEEWKRIQSLSSKRWEYIPNCAPDEEDAKVLLQISKKEMRRKLRLPEEPFIGLCLASVQARKGQDVLLRQLREVVKRLPDALFLFVGPILWQWEGQNIINYAQSNFSVKNVQFLGPRENPLEYILASDCLVLPSREEALPLTILEAMLLARPVVASDVNGIPELVVPEETGLLFSHNTPQDLGRHILRLASDMQLAESMGAAGQKRYFENFSRERHAARWRAFLLGLTAKNFIINKKSVHEC